MDTITLSDRLVSCHCGDGSCILCDDTGTRDLIDVLNEFAPGAWLEHDTDAPAPFAVWSEDDEIIGAGETASEAIVDAHATVRGWESNYYRDVGLRVDLSRGVGPDRYPSPGGAR